MEPSDKRLTVGIVGAGNVTSQYHLPVLSVMPEVSVRWLCDIDREKARTLARAYSIKGAHESVNDCPDVDIALIAVPVGLRRGCLERAFERGWNAMLEKPAAVDTPDFDWIAAAARRSGVQVGVGLMRRFYAATRLAAHLTASQCFGNLKKAVAHECFHLRSTGRQGDWYQTDSRAAGGGVLQETGSHLVDQVLHMVRASAVRVTSAEFAGASTTELEARVRGTTASGFGPVDVEINIAWDQLIDSSVILSYEGCTVIAGSGYDSLVRILNDRGEPVVTLPTSTAPDPYYAFIAEWKAFLRQCTDAQPSEVAYETARLSTDFIDSAYRFKTHLRTKIWPQKELSPLAARTARSGERFAAN